MGRDDDERGIRAALTRREDLLQLVASAAILGLGINLLSSVLMRRYENTPYVMPISGASLIAISFWYISRILMKVRRISRTFQGTLVYHSRDMTIICPPEYDLARRVAETLQAGFAENHALKVAWESEPLRPQTAADETPSVASEPQSETGPYVAIVKVRLSETAGSNPRSAVILREALEYSLLEELSLHLSTYFNDYDDEDRFVKEYTRDDFPKLLLQNRFLALLSTPLEDRAIFVKAGLAKNPPDGEVHMLVGPKGERFQRFDLALPAGTRVERPEIGYLRLETSRLSISLRARYDGHSTTLPQGFEEGILRCHDEQLAPLKVEIDVEVKIKMASLLRFGGWRYYEWVDSFISRLDEFASFDSYLERVQWQSARTALRVFRNSIKFEQASSRRSPRVRRTDQAPKHDGAED